jgi:hypothetical protein
MGVVGLVPGRNTYGVRSILPKLLRSSSIRCTLAGCFSGKLSVTTGRIFPSRTYSITCSSPVRDVLVVLRISTLFRKMRAVLIWMRLLDSSPTRTNRPARPMLLQVGSNSGPRHQDSPDCVIFAEPMCRSGNREVSVCVFNTKDDAMTSSGYSIE